MNIWYVVVGAIIVFISLIVGTLIGWALADKNDYDNYEDSENDNENDNAVLISNCLNDKKVQEVLNTYQDGIVKIEKDGLNHNLIKLIDEYILMEVELNSFNTHGYVYFTIDEEDYKNYHKKTSITI